MFLSELGVRIGALEGSVGVSPNSQSILIGFGFVS